MQHVVSIGEKLVSRDPADVLITYSLGSCIGISAWDPEAGLGGLIHCMLPLSSADPEKAQANPCLYVDTGVAALLDEMFDQGASKEQLIIKVAGASSILDPKGIFRVGERNYTVLRKILWKNNILIKAEAIGGDQPRTMALEVGSGNTTIRSNGKVNIL